MPAIFLTLVEGDNYDSPLVGRNLAGSPDVIKGCGKFPQHSVSDNVPPQAFINSAGMLQNPTALPDFNLETAAWISAWDLKLIKYKPRVRAISCDVWIIGSPWPEASLLATPQNNQQITAKSGPLQRTAVFRKDCIWPRRVLFTVKLGDSWKSRHRITHK